MFLMVDDNQESVEAVSWTASEFIARQKSPGWYFALGLVALALAALLYWLTKDAVTGAVVVICALFFGIFAARQPRQLEYGIDRKGVKVGVRQYGFQDFKSFSVINEGSFGAINLMPLKRFSPELTIYYAPEQEQQIVAILSNYLPFEEARPDRIENLMRRIGF